jgi:hypothetical protein
MSLNHKLKKAVTYSDKLKHHKHDKDVPRAFADILENIYNTEYPLKTQCFRKK